MGSIFYLIFIKYEKYTFSAFLRINFSGKYADCLLVCIGIFKPHSMSQTGVTIFGGFQAVVAQCKVQFGQTRYQTKSLIEYYHNKLYEKLSMALVKFYR